MPLTPPLPSEDDDYQAPPGTRLNFEVWNSVFLSISLRIKELEAQRTDLQVVIDAGTDQALAMIATNLEPLIIAITAQIEELNTQADLLAGQFATILAGGVPGTSVTLTAISGMTAGDAQEAFEELKVAIDTHTTQIASNATAIAAAASRSDAIALAIALG